MSVGTIKVKKLREDAVIPSKKESDIGFDVTLTHLIDRGEDIFLEKYSNKYTYGTGIAVTPPKGYYLDMVPRSSFAKTGYVVGNSIGIIDPTYTGELKAILYKVNPDAPDLEVPARYFQLVLRPIITAGVEEVAELEKTERGDGGFGSTGLK